MILLPVLAAVCHEGYRSQDNECRPCCGLRPGEEDLGAGLAADLGREKRTGTLTLRGAGFGWILSKQMAE